jgi:hypothetical protein
MFTRLSPDRQACRGAGGAPAVGRDPTIARRWHPACCYQVAASRAAANPSRRLPPPRGRAPREKGTGVGVGPIARDGLESVSVLGATEQEADEGYFSRGQDSMVVAKQGSDLHKWLKSHVGQRVRLRLDLETAGQ